MITNYFQKNHFVGKYHCQQFQCFNCEYAIFFKHTEFMDKPNKISIYSKQFGTLPAKAYNMSLKNSSRMMSLWKTVIADQYSGHGLR